GGRNGFGVLQPLHRNRARVDRRLLPPARSGPGRVGAPSGPALVDVDWGPAPGRGGRLRALGFAVEKHAGDSGLGVTRPRAFGSPTADRARDARFEPGRRGGLFAPAR